MIYAQKVHISTEIDHACPQLVTICPKLLVFWCGQGESNSRLRLGKAPFYH